MSLLTVGLTPEALAEFDFKPIADAGTKSPLPTCEEWSLVLGNLRIAWELAVMPKTRLVAFVDEMGEDDSEAVADQLASTKRLIASLAELTGAVEVRLISAMAVVALREPPDPEK